MDNNSDYHLLIIQDKIDANVKYSDEKTKNLIEDLTATTASIMDHTK